MTNSNGQHDLHLGEVIDEVEKRGILLLIIPLAIGSAIVSTALLCGMAVIFLDGTLFTKDDLVPMIFLTAIALVGFGISLRAFNHVFKGGVSLSPLLTWVSRSLPVLWIAGLAIGYFSAADMIKTQKGRAEEHRQSTCGALLPEKDGRMNGCLNAVKMCDEEANRCKKIGSQEDAKLCTTEFKERLGRLKEADQKRVREPNGSYEPALFEVCIFERIQE